MRYTKPSKWRLPKEARSIPVRGKGDDAGKYFECWNCGFICNIDRDDSSGSTAGDNHIDYSSPALGYVESGEGDRIMTLDSPNFYHTMLEPGSDGEPKTIVHSHLTNITKGCPFCGTTNYRS